MHDEKYVTKAVKALMTSGAHTATVYVSDKWTVRVTRQMFGPRGKRRFNDARRSIDIALTIGRPNYAARAFIKAAKQAGEPFPIRKVQLTFPA